MQRKFLTYCLLFFIPVVIGYFALEYFSGQLPSALSENEKYLKNEQNSIQTLVLGSSQMQGAINPEWLDSPTLNLASGDQHHDTDFKLLKEMISRLPKLETVVLEVSYSHFELPHNGKNFWKNSLYLKYYNVNCFERSTYFKDRLLYLANPNFYSKQLHSHYVKRIDRTSFNDFGFNMNNYKGAFEELKYDEQRIADMRSFKINRKPNLQIFEINTALFHKMLEFLAKKELQVIITKVPMYKTYHNKKVPAILERRDSVISTILMQYPNTHLLDLENDTLNYNVEDYWNQSHLNPDGGLKFTAQLNSLLNTLE
ncbi:MAG: hypothetical protein JKY22_05575 [Flavobacteriaceae bacterium]|nr:hypothetical protein [Flavobacteriaceae bacterium]